MLKKASFILSVIIVMALLFAVQALAAPTAAPDAASITISNKLTGIPDTVTVTGVDAGDIIRVYGVSTGGTPLGATVAGAASTVYINQLGANGGSAYVSIQESGFEESTRTPKPFDAESRTDTPDVDDITIQNNVSGSPDVITVENVSGGDIVRVYQSSAGASVLAATVSGGSTATLYVNQLGINGGTVYVSVQGENEIESARIQKSYDTETTSALGAAAVTVVNNLYKETAPGVQDLASRDTATVTGAADGDIINIYKSVSGSEKWAGPVTSAGGSDTVYISDLGKAAGKLFVTVTKPGKAESKRQSYAIPAETVTPPLTTGRVTVTNNYGVADDAIEVFNLVANDIIRIYATATAEAEIGSGTVAAGEDSVEITLNAVHLSASGGTIYITRTTTDANESTRLAKTYLKELTANPPSKANFTVTNSFGPDNDSLKAINLTVGDIIRIYGTAKGDTLIGSMTADAMTENIPLNPGALSYNGGTVYVSIATGTSAESARTAVTYGKEEVAARPADNTITVANNYNTGDTVAVSGLTENDVIKVYAAAKGGLPVGTGTAGADGTATATVDAGILKAAGGTLYVTVTTSVANESARTPKTYGEEPTTGAPSLDNITVINRYGLPDDVTVSGLTDGDLVKIYTNPSAAAIATVTADAASETLEIPAGKLSAASGKLYVSVKSTGKNESPKAIKPYESEKTAAPINGTVTVQNNYEGTNDRVTVTGVAAGDIIKVYKAAGSTDMWGTVPAADTSVTIDIPQLGPKAGKIYVTITKSQKAESARTAVPYLSEPVTTMEGVKITVQNNFNTEDNVILEGLADGQIVTLYSSATGSAALGTVTATGETYTFVLDDGQLTAKGGKLYVTVKNPLELESVRTAVTYSSEITVAPKAGNILVVNHTGTQYDTVTVIGLTAGDTVTIYSQLTGGSVLASETVADRGTTIVLETNLNDVVRKIYVTVTSEGKAESTRTAVSYYAA
jgi:hypothetical protein